MCCVCSLLSKIISLIVSILSIVLLVLLILWLTGVLFGNDNDSPARSTNEYLKSAGEYKYSAIGSSLT